MPLEIASINSGSNGNCYYVGNSDHAILVDAGISCREIERRMIKLGLSIEKVKAIFISHEHADHITGLPRLSSKYRLPVYITQATLRESKLPVEASLVTNISHGKTFHVGDIQVTAFKKSHDAVDPHSFVIRNENVNVGVFTDIGHSCRDVIRYFKECDAVFLESNYCDDMLEKSHYPYYLKKRISSDHGHLSNSQALELFTRHRTEKLSHLILSHLSKNNNHPDLVSNLFSPHAGNTTITIASRYEPGEVIRVESKGSNYTLPVRSFISERPVQLALF